MKKTFVLTAVLLLAPVLSGTASALDEKVYTDVTQRAMALIDGGRIDEGIKVMRDQAKKDPSEGAWQASLGEYLMQLSQRSAVKDKDRSKKWLKDAEESFKKAAELFKKQNKPAFEAQSYYYLGVIEEQGRGNFEKGKVWYGKTLAIFPDQPQAKKAMSRYGEWRLAMAQERAKKTT